jgi:hypothetical protein
MARIFGDGDYSAPIRRFRCPIFHAAARTAATSLGRFLHGPKSMAKKKREDLDEFNRHLAMLSVPGVEGVYKTAYNDCSVSDLLLAVLKAATGVLNRIATASVRRCGNLIIHSAIRPHPRLR